MRDSLRILDLASSASFSLSTQQVVIFMRRSSTMLRTALVFLRLTGPTLYSWDELGCAMAVGMRVSSPSLAAMHVFDARVLREGVYRPMVRACAQEFFEQVS